MRHEGLCTSDRLVWLGLKLKFKRQESHLIGASLTVPRSVWVSGVFSALPCFSTSWIAEGFRAGLFRSTTPSTRISANSELYQPLPPSLHPRSRWALATALGMKYGAGSMRLYLACAEIVGLETELFRRVVLSTHVIVPDVGSDQTLAHHSINDGCLNGRKLRRWR